LSCRQTTERETVVGRDATAESGVTPGTAASRGEDTVGITADFTNHGAEPSAEALPVPTGAVSAV
jgi:hypothetical protein